MEKEESLLMKLFSVSNIILLLGEQHDNTPRFPFVRKRGILLNKDMANEFSNLKKALEDYMDAVSRIYKGKLNADGHKATGKLIGSVKANVIIGNTQYTGELRLEDYWKYIEYGTKPHFPPKQALIKWIQAKPILPRAINGITPTNDQLAFLIGRKISQTGTQPGGELGSTIEEVNRAYKPILESALEQDLSGELTVIFNNF